ncbi:uncharacterized protein [Watersipora subatra]|uniref:uncharacterized protein isoform X2 n=1 Tax=Watersipora subatra TaxID=2589382 RepID=UPI00355B1542
MFHTNTFTVQPFAQSKLKTDRNMDALDLLKTSNLNSRRCCSPCKNGEVVRVRPVLCSKQLSEADTTTQRQLQDGFGVGSYHRTPAGGAWVEHNSQGDCEQVENWERARRYNEEVESCSEEKAFRLKAFQKELELERNVARTTAYLAQASIPYASEVTVRGRTDRIIKDSTFQAVADAENKNPSTDALAKMAKSNTIVEQERSLKRKARLNLGSKQLTNLVGKELPGGCWRETPLVEFHGYDDEKPDNSDQQNLQVPAYTGVPGASNILAEELSQKQTERKEKVPKKNALQRSLAYTISGQEEEEIRKQEVKQRSLLRRLYMDIEREQVKEYRKMKEHMDRIAQIKQAKEEERKRQELEASRASLPTFPGGCVADANARKAVELERIQKQQTETNRYIKALRSLLKEKIERLGIEMPPLCSCGNDIWDAHPDVCANNCQFYKNPKGYERAVQSLLASCDVLD